MLKNTTERKSCKYQGSKVKYPRMEIFKKYKKFWLVLLDLIMNLAIIFGIVLVIREFIIAPFQISGPSMCNSFNYYNDKCQHGNGEYIILNKWEYLFHDPKRYDVVVFHPPHDDEIFYIKRIIGIPGDKVEFNDNGYIYINDKKLDEPYLNEDNLGETKSEWIHQIGEIPEGNYLVLGDNRKESTDARTCFIGNKYGCTDETKSEYLTMDNIQGKAWISLWPPSIIRIIKNPQDLAEK